MNIEQFINLAEIHAAVDYGNPKSVKVGNSAADRMREIAHNFYDSGKIDELLSLLEHQHAGLWVAFIVGDLENATATQVERCLCLIRSLADGDSVDSIGAKYWLEERGLNDS